MSKERMFNMWDNFMEDWALAKKIARAKHAGKDKTEFKHRNAKHYCASTPGTYDGCYGSKEVQS